MTADCTNKELGRLLHAWELGQLTEEEADQLEEHLLECTHCYERAKRFENFASALRDDPDVRDTVLSEDRFHDEPSSRRRTIAIAVIPLLAAAAVLLLVLKPWEIQFRPSKDAVAGGQRLAVTYLDDSNDPTGSGNLLASLLITDLSEAGTLDVLSRESVNDLFRSVAPGPDAMLDRQEAIRLARDNNVRWLLFGNLPGGGDSILVNIELVDARTGAVISTKQSSCVGPVSVFCVTDKLTKEIKESLPLPVSARTAYDPPVEQLTSHSVEAYRLYLEGVDQYFKYHYAEAADNFHAALSQDSTFAMVWYYLSRLTTGAERRRLTEKALRYSADLNWREQQLIKAWHARVIGRPNDALDLLHAFLARHPTEKAVLVDLAKTFKWSFGEWDSSVYYFQEALRYDSTLKEAYLNLAWDFRHLDQQDRSLWAAHKYIDLAPDEANAHSTMGDIYWQQGWDDSALTSFNKALELKPGFYEALYGIGNIYAFRRQLSEAEQWYRGLLDAPEAYWRSCGRLFLAHIPLNKGQFRQGLTVLTEMINADEDDSHFGEWYLHKRILRSLVFLELQDTISALAEIDSMAAHYHDFDSLDYYPLVIQSWVYAECNRFKKARALVSRIKEEANRQLPDNSIAYDMAEGFVNLASNNAETAREHFFRAVNNPMTWQTSYVYLAHVMEARACLDAGHYDESVTKFEYLLTQRYHSSRFWILWHNRIYYWLAQAYEGAGRPRDASREYQTFLSLFENADFETDYMRNARHRLEILKGR